MKQELLLSPLFGKRLISFCPKVLTMKIKRRCGRGGGEGNQAWLWIKSGLTKNHNKIEESIVALNEMWNITKHQRKPLKCGKKKVFLWVTEHVYVWHFKLTYISSLQVERWRGSWHTGLKLRGEINKWMLQLYIDDIHRTEEKPQGTQPWYTLTI